MVHKRRNSENVDIFAYLFNDLSSGISNYTFLFISNSIFQLSLELLNTVFNINENLGGPLLQIGVQTSFQSEFFHLAEENFEDIVRFSSFCQATAEISASGRKNGVAYKKRVYRFPSGTR